MPRPLRLLALLLPLLLADCGSFGSGNMGGPSVAQRNAQIANEATGNFYYGRRYFVCKTRFWGYLRKPREPWSTAKLVIFHEGSKLNPDRLPENGPPGQRYSFDHNTDYRIYGHFTGREGYEPNSNQFLPVFQLTGYEVIDRHPGWLFRPEDHYNQFQITVVPR